MNKPEAETIFDLGKEATVAKLLEQDEQIKKTYETARLPEKVFQQFFQTAVNGWPGQKALSQKAKTKRSKNQVAKRGTGAKNERSSPAEQMDQIHHLYPGGCEKCGNLLAWRARLHGVVSPSGN